MLDARLSNACRVKPEKLHVSCPLVHGWLALSSQVCGQCRSKRPLACDALGVVGHSFCLAFMTGSNVPSLFDTMLTFRSWKMSRMSIRMKSN